MSIDLFVFVICIIFFRVPNFYLIPTVHSAILTTQGLARILIFLVVVLQVRTVYKAKRLSFEKFLLLLFLVTQSFSVLPSQNISSFMSRYKDIVVGIVFFFLASRYREKKNIILQALFLPSGLNILYQIFMVIFPDLYLRFFSIFLYDKHFSLVQFNIQRGRSYIETHDEAMLPFYLYGAQATNNKYIKILFIIIAGGVAVSSFISGWRTRTLMVLFSITLFVVIGIKKSIKQLAGFFLISFVGIVLVIGITQQHNRISFIDRVTDTEESPTSSTLNVRMEQIGLAYAVSFFSPFGVGLGNYYDMLPNSKKGRNLFEKYTMNATTAEYVHNMFGSILAESGIVGLLVFLLLMGKWIKTDFEEFSMYDIWDRLIVIAFWCLCISGMLNPINVGSFHVLFFVLRGLLSQ